VLDGRADERPTPTMTVTISSARSRAVVRLCNSKLNLLSHLIIVPPAQRMDELAAENVELSERLDAVAAIVEKTDATAT